MNVDDGFFPDSSWSIFARPTGAMQLSEVVDEPCLVLLGEPGLGKSHAIADAVDELRQTGPSVRVVDLGAYEESASLVGAIVDSSAWRTWRASETVLHLFLDGLDEALLHAKAVHKRLIVALDALGDDIGRLRLRISCRSAEWLPDFEARLADVFGADGVPRRLALAPLRAVDAAEAARAESIDADRFLAEIVERGLERLAAFPLTLRMMIDEARSGGGALPATQAELFDRAILRLAEEHDVARRRELVGAALHVGQRVVVAERIAAAMLLGGKAAVQVDLTARSGADLTIRELAGFAEQDPAAAGGASFAVGVDQIQEVLATALFADLGGGRLTLTHRRLAEYLAARYLVHHHMDVEQVMSLLAAADDPDGRLIPQLREVAAWTATLAEDVLVDIMDREPELLLRADALTFTDDARARLVDSLLTEEPAMRVERYDRRVRRAFAGLAHPGFGDQIRNALRAGRPIVVRQMAFALAKAVATPELQPDLIAFAFDLDEPAFLRDDAVWALKDYADDEARAALVPLATERIEDDVDDEIKGQALEAVFPFQLGVTDVLRVLTPARNEHLLGAYKMFVSRTFLEALRPEDLPEVLEWARTVPRDHSPTDLLSSLTDDVLALAWPHLDVEAPFRARAREATEKRRPGHGPDDPRPSRRPRSRRRRRVVETQRRADLRQVRSRRQRSRARGRCHAARRLGARRW